MTSQDKNTKLSIFSIGMAMFSMFFGSGNIIFPALLGRDTQSSVFFAVCGLIITAVVIPFAGLLTISLFQGNYVSFFSRLGKIPAWIAITGIMSLIGPFAVVPRCIVIAYGAIETMLPNVSLIEFSAVSCALVFVCTLNPKRVMHILGIYLTPVLLMALLTIITKGLLSAPESVSGASEFATKQMPALDAFSLGLLEGYNTMDLFASFLFSGLVLNGIRESNHDITKKPKELLKVYLQASAVGMGLLAAIYCGICYVTAIHSVNLSGVADDKILGELAILVLGPFAGLAVCLAVSIACLTTAISLVLVFSEFISLKVVSRKISYKKILFATMLVSFSISTLDFNGIQAILVPVLKLSLPALMALTAVNLLHKFTGFKPVKTIVASTFIASILYQYFI